MKHSIASASWSGNRLDIFGLGTDNQMWQKAWTGNAWWPSPTDWAPLGGKFNSPPAAVAWGPNRLDIFGLGTDNQIYHKAWTGNAWGPSPTDWTPLGGKFTQTGAVMGLIPEITRILSKSPGKEGVTYMRTSGNKFTLLDTPRLWDKDPTAAAQRSEACQALLDKITDVIGSAGRTLDITLLFNSDLKSRGFPDGGFQDAISRGFKTLSDNGRRPTIRILLGTPLNPDWHRYLPVPIIGLPVGVVPDMAKAIIRRMEEWLVDTITKHQTVAAMKSQIQMGLNHPNIFSHNHTKIIVADDRRVIAGGHNLWAGDYLGAAPIHDVSGLFEGPAARAARQFCDKLWSLTTHQTNLIDGKFAPLPKLPRVFNLDPQPPEGNVEMLSLGRLGKGLAEFSISSNASVTARVVAICKAKSIIRISQQSLLGFGTAPYDFFTCLAIVRAIRAGVDVQIVVSNELENYGGSASKVLRQLQAIYIEDVKSLRAEYDYRTIPPREDTDAWADLAAGSFSLAKPLEWSKDWGHPENVNLLAEFNRKLKLATLYYSNNFNKWQVGREWKDAGNHAKVYIIDDRCFYVGSDNFYVSLTKEGLQEFGYLVEDQQETKKFVADYWDKLWKYSGKHALN